MKKLWIVTKFELLRYFTSPLAYIYLVSFLLLNGACAFYFGHFFERGQANLNPMFWYQPWLYLLFASGISMRLWAEEFRTKTVVQIMTMPVLPSTLVWGKFLASWLFCALALVLTFVFWITVNVLGSPDNLVILTGYIGSLVLVGAMLAVGQTMSALTKNQVIALVLAVAANLFFFWSGIEFVLAFFRLFLPDYLVDTIASFSFLTHFNNIIIGIVTLADVLFFASVILLFNFTTVLIVSFRTSGTASWLHSTNRAYYVWAWCALMIGFLGFNLLVNNITRGIQADLTQDRLYTLNPSTVKILRQAPEPLTAKLYFSTILEQRNPAMRQMFDRVRILLEQYKNASNGKFEYRIYHPQSLDDAEDRAIGDGLQPIPLIDLNQNALFGLTLTDTLNNKKVIPMFMPERMAYLEQDLTSLVYQLTHKKKTIGLISSLALGGGGTDSMLTQPWAIYDKVSEFYDIRNISQPSDFEQRPDILWIVHPQMLSAPMVEAIKNYSRDYGKILLLLDGAAEAPRLYSPENSPLLPSELFGLDAFWGFRFYNEYVVADLGNSITVDATQNYDTNPTFTQDVIQFKIRKNNFNPKAEITQNLKNILFSSASVIMPLEGHEKGFAPLLTAGANSALMPMDMVYKGLNPREILSYFKKDDNPKILAALILGQTAENPFMLIVAGDTDFIYNNFWTTPVPMLDKTYFMPLFNNADFILNSLDYLSNMPDLMPLRGKSERDRSFEGLEALRRENMFAYKVKEEEILNRLDEAKEQLQEIWGKKTFEEREMFTPDELALIGGVRKKLDTARFELGELRLQINQNIDEIEMLIKFINIFAVPLILSLGLLIWAYYKRQKTSVKAQRRFINKGLIVLSLSALGVLLAGIVSVYIFNRSSLEQFEDKPLLPALPDEINNVSKIVLKSHQNTLTFELKDKTWVLLEHPDFAVYQERIRSFLSALMEARFYEKKSDKAQNLAAFGLEPIEREGSPNTRIELFDDKGSTLQTLEVGAYNIDLGRGNMAAYVKFDNLFQVWLAQADFIDLSTDWHDWTYSTAWNMRYGRLQAVNGSEDVNLLANLAKELLNTPFEAVTDSISKKSELLNLNILAEDGLSLDLKFYQSGNKYYVFYDVKDNSENKSFELFQDFLKGRYVEIAASRWEKINALFHTK